MTQLTHIASDNLTKLKSFYDFLKLVRDFCDLIENYIPENKLVFLEVTQTQLQNLYLTGRQLQFVDLIHNAISEALVSKNDLENISNFIAERLGNNRCYWHVFDPTNDNEAELVCGDLLDDLCDVYQDLKKAILLFDIAKPAEIERALWNLKWSFDNHWADSCINAAYALHYFIQRTS